MIEMKTLHKLLVFGIVVAIIGMSILLVRDARREALRVCVRDYPNHHAIEVADMSGFYLYRGARSVDVLVEGDGEYTLRVEWRECPKEDDR